MLESNPAGYHQGRERSRLKPISIDYLESIGLPSKGDNSLLNFETQEVYYAKLMARYNEFRSTKDAKGRLDDAFTSLSLDRTTSRGFERGKTFSNGRKSFETEITNSRSNSDDLSIILMAMRKIREAIVASSRQDAFASGVYAWIIRTTILLKHMESYHPALLHLLFKIHPVTPLPESDYKEIVGYYILDLACRQDDVAAAYQTVYRSNHEDSKVEAVLKALVHGNWYQFWTLYSEVGIHQRALMEWAGDRVRTHAIKCLGKTYLSVDKRFLEEAVQCEWEHLAEKDGLGWKLDDQVVTIRRINKK